MDIHVRPDGPYVVDGVPLGRAEAEVDEHGDKTGWRFGERLREGGHYELCRCGHSSDKPFCDDTHEDVGFAGACTWEPSEANHLKTPGELVINDDRSRCAHFGFCANRISNLWKMRRDPEALETIKAMARNCPSGALSYDGEPVEPDGLWITPDGPLRVTGNVTIHFPDGTSVTRTKAVLCRCGHSASKPFCDGSHTSTGFQAG